MTETLLKRARLQDSGSHKGAREMGSDHPGEDIPPDPGSQKESMSSQRLRFASSHSTLCMRYIIL